MDEQRLLEQLKDGMKLRLKKRFLSMRAYISPSFSALSAARWQGEDLQEVVNDTFYSLWVNAERIDLDKGSL